MTGIDETVDEGHSYFEEIEAAFVRLRGAPLLLSPADWQVAKEWQEAGIPLELVQRTLEEVFARRKERGAQGRIQSLRFCAEAVWQAWNETTELKAGGKRKSVIAMEVQPRLDALASSLPLEMSNRDQWVERIAGLTGTSDEVEGHLSELDSEILTVAEREMGPEDRNELASRVDATLSSLRDRLPESEIDQARDRIRRGILRDLSNLPVLSLFSPGALSE